MKLLLRWSLRDLRARWLQVTVIALVIAIGTGAYAGMSSINKWRRISTDAGYETLNMHDVRVRLVDGAELPPGELAEAIRETGGEAVVAISERLIGSVQIDITHKGRDVILAGAIYGVELDSGPTVDALHFSRGVPPDSGEGPAPGEGSPPGELQVALERNFANFHDLPETGQVTFSGGLTAAITGHAIAPDLFIPLPDEGTNVFGQASFGIVFASLETAGAISGRGDVVNDAVVQLAPGTDREAFRDLLDRDLGALLGGTGFDARTREESPSYRINDLDIKGDQQTFNVIAFFILGGATVAAFNLTARIVESQRREIGIAMTLGLTPARIAVRPMLVGAEIAFLGILFGLGVGALIAWAMASALDGLQPLPEWQTPLQTEIFVRAAALGFIIPFAASAWPVSRAVRVPPVEAIRAGYRAARGWGWAPWLRGLRFPGNTFVQVPVRNVIRTPRRTLLTAVGVGAAVAILVSFVGMIDSLVATADLADEATFTGSEDRVEVELTTFHAAGGPVVADVLASPSVANAEASLLVAAFMRGEGQDKSIVGVVSLLDLTEGIWGPELNGAAPQRDVPGIYLSELAARDLGADRGESVSLSHPLFSDDGTVSLATTELEVLGTHPHPFRFVAYMDASLAGVFNLEGQANHVVLEPAAGVSLADVKRDLSAREGVAFVQGAGETAAGVRDGINEFIGIFRVIEAAVLLLAVLIAFNSASINIDERAREHATMFAFGVRVRTVMWMAIVENFILYLK